MFNRYAKFFGMSGKGRVGSGSSGGRGGRGGRRGGRGGSGGRRGSGGRGGSGSPLRSTINVRERTPNSPGSTSATPSASQSDPRSASQSASQSARLPVNPAVSRQLFNSNNSQPAASAAALQAPTPTGLERALQELVSSTRPTNPREIVLLENVKKLLERALLSSSSSSSAALPSSSSSSSSAYDLMFNETIAQLLPFFSATSLIRVIEMEDSAAKCVDSDEKSRFDQKCALVQTKFSASDLNKFHSWTSEEQYISFNTPTTGGDIPGPGETRLASRLGTTPNGSGFSYDMVINIDGACYKLEVKKLEPDGSFNTGIKFKIYAIEHFHKKIAPLLDNLAKLYNDILRGGFNMLPIDSDRLSKSLFLIEDSFDGGLVEGAEGLLLAIQIVCSYLHNIKNHLMKIDTINDRGYPQLALFLSYLDHEFINYPSQIRIKLNELINPFREENIKLAFVSESGFIILGNPLDEENACIRFSRFTRGASRFRVYGPAFQKILLSRNDLPTVSVSKKNRQEELDRLVSAISHGKNMSRDDVEKIKKDLEKMTEDDSPEKQLIEDYSTAISLFKQSQAKKPVSPGSYSSYTSGSQTDSTFNPSRQSTSSSSQCSFPDTQEDIQQHRTEDIDLIDKIIRIMTFIRDYSTSGVITEEALYRIWVLLERKLMEVREFVKQVNISKEQALKLSQLVVNVRAILNSVHFTYGMFLRERLLHHLQIIVLSIS